MIVADASALIELLLESSSHAALATRTAAGEVHVPYLADLEVAQVLRRTAAQGKLQPAHALLALAVYRDFPLVREPHEPLLDRIWQLRHNLSAYDASYVALAEALGAELLTCDLKLANAPGPRCLITLL